MLAPDVQCVCCCPHRHQPTSRSPTGPWAPWWRGHACGPWGPFVFGRHARWGAAAGGAPSWWSVGPHCTSWDAGMGLVLWRGCVGMRVQQGTTHGAFHFMHHRVLGQTILRGALAGPPILMCSPQDQGGVPTGTTCLVECCHAMLSRTWGF